MDQAQKALLELKSMDALAKIDSPVRRMAPEAKLLMTVGFILTTVSFPKYNITGLLVMVLFPLLGYTFSYISVRTCFAKCKLVMPLVCAVGLFNPLFDRRILFSVGGVGISGGWISLVTLLLKGMFCLETSFLLAATTPIEEICAALRRLHCPKLFTSLLLLTYRYISLLLQEVSVMSQAYYLRAPGQKGIHYKAWGSFLGQLMLRTMDRGQALYESMKLRGFQGDFYYAEHQNDKMVLVRSMTIAVLFIGLMVAARVFPVVNLLGSIVR